ncbi:MAG: hypothetical protein IKD37_02200 [Clostridia bacterium]|nr:hypothetical protein [Clostridia bacterium]
MRQLAILLCLLMLFCACSPDLPPVIPDATDTAEPDTTVAPVTTAPPADDTAAPVQTQTVDEAWAALGFPDYDSWVLDAARALITGDGTALAKTFGLPAETYAAYNGMVVTDWSLRREAIPAEDDPAQIRELPVLDLEIASGGTDVLGPGRHSLVMLGELYAYFTPRDSYRWYVHGHRGESSAAQQYVSTFIALGGDSFDDLRAERRLQFGLCDFIAIRLARISGSDAPRTADAIRNYAETILDVPGSALDFSKVMAVDGGYVQWGRGAYAPIYDWVSEETRDGATVVTVQFWADYSRTVKSRRIEYHLEPGTVDFRPIKTVIVEDSGLRTASVAV